MSLIFAAIFLSLFDRDIMRLFYGPPVVVHNVEYVNVTGQPGERVSIILDIDKRRQCPSLIYGSWFQDETPFHISASIGALTPALGRSEIDVKLRIPEEAPVGTVKYTWEVVSFCEEATHKISSRDSIGAIPVFVLEPK